MSPKEAQTTQDFAAVIGKSPYGKKVLKIVSEKWWQNALNSFQDGEKVTVLLTSTKPKRSDQQNRYYWGAYLPLISSETGETEERLHELFKGMFLTKEVVPVLGHLVRMRGSTAKLSKSGFTEYIQKIEELTGIQSPPVENYFDETKEETHESEQRDKEGEGAGKLRLRTPEVLGTRPKGAADAGERQRTPEKRYRYGSGMVN